jgi:predicted nucleic-acid-binding protein
MIALDTNVIVRFLVRDDPKQARAVYSRLKQAEADREPLFVPLVVVLETIWVLESAYDLSREEVLNALQDMGQMPALDLEAAEVVQRLVSSGRNAKADLPDLLIAHSAEAAGCEAGLTFDTKAAKLPFFRLLR